MKTELTIFRILTFILLPISAFFGCMDIMMLFMALGNPAQLLPVFLIAAFVIYIFASLRFLTRHIDPNLPAKPSLRDWIRVNGFASLAMGLMSLASTSLLVLSGDEKIKEMISTAMEAQASAPMINETAFIGVFKGAIWFMLAVSTLLLVHVILCFRALRRYRHLFSASQS